MSEALYRFVRWCFGLLGFIPATDAHRAEAFETTLMMLLPSDQDRERFREGALMLVQALAEAYARHGASMRPERGEG